MQLINQSLERLQKYIEQENYRGWDPYDALSSPLFNLPFLRSNKIMRFGIQQLVKRSPINLRHLLRVRKGYNPVTLGLCIQGYSFLYKIETQEIVKQELIYKIEFLIDELISLQAVGFSGTCWGYDFDWEARHAKIPAFKPTVVATGMITNALFICYKVTGNQKAKELLISSANFVLKDLNRTQTTNHLTSSIIFLPFCFSYSPFDEQVVYNASMKGARILSQVYSITKDKKFIAEAKNAVEFVVKEQRQDGSWYYSAKGNGKWIDNYHTGYVLDCLDEYRINSNDNSYNEHIKRGYEYYKNNFFEDDGAPKFYNNKKYPIDCTAGSQSILTLTRFGNREIAYKVADYMIKNMQDNEGYFYFRDYGKRTDKTSFMRWSNAWMFVGLSYLLSKENELK